MLKTRVSNEKRMAVFIFNFRSICCKPCSSGDDDIDVTLQFCRTTGIETIINGYQRSGWYDTIGIKMICEYCYHGQFQTFCNYRKHFILRHFPADAGIHHADCEIAWGSLTTVTGGIQLILREIFKELTVDPCSANKILESPVDLVMESLKAALHQGSAQLSCSGELLKVFKKRGQLLNRGWGDWDSITARATW